MKKSLPVLLTLFLITGSANAHEGHGISGQGHTVKHYLTEPIHLVGTVLALSAIVIGAMYWARLNSRHRTIQIAASRISAENSSSDRIESQE